MVEQPASPSMPSSMGNPIQQQNDPVSDDWCSLCGRNASPPCPMCPTYGPSTSDASTASDLPSSTGGKGDSSPCDEQQSRPGWSAEDFPEITADEAIEGVKAVRRDRTGDS